MKVLNKTRGIILSKDAGMADSFFSRLKGLMFTKKRDLIIKAHGESVMDSSIHMMFMLQPIDVIWVDSKMRVVDVKEKVKPHDFRRPCTWRVYKPANPALYVIELGAGHAGKTRIGDEVEITG